MLCSSLSSLRNPYFKHLIFSSYLRPLILPCFFSPPTKINRIRENGMISSQVLTERWISTSSSNLSSSSLDNWPHSDFSSASYLSVRLRCPKDIADTLSEALLCFGACSASMDEPENSEVTNEIFVNSIFTEPQNIDRCILHAADSIGLKEIPSYEVIVDDEQSDWVKKSQESFQPVEVTEGLWIVPEWITPPDSQAINIILNPGLAFGTGDHPTTNLCLLLLHGLIKGGESFFDYGTGSGILAIAAVKLGAALAVGIDIDPEAITSATQNAVLNHIEPEKLKFSLVTSRNTTNTLTAGTTCGDAELKNAVAETEKYDIVIANILLNPLLELADNIASYAKPGGVIVVSGIILASSHKLKFVILSTSEIYQYQIWMVGHVLVAERERILYPTEKCENKFIWWNMKHEQFFYDSSQEPLLLCRWQRTDEGTSHLQNIGTFVLQL